MWPCSSTGCAVTRGERVEQRADAVRAVVGWCLAGGADHPDQLVLGPDAPRARGLARGGEVCQQIVERASGNGIVFVDEVHAVRGL